MDQLDGLRRLILQTHGTQRDGMTGGGMGIREAIMNTHHLTQESAEYTA
jgi:hypothetical protein